MRGHCEKEVWISMLLCLKFEKLSQSIDICPKAYYNIDEPRR